MIICHTKFGKVVFKTSVFDDITINFLSFIKSKYNETSLFNKFFHLKFSKNNNYLKIVANLDFLIFKFYFI